MYKSNFPSNFNIIINRDRLIFELNCWPINNYCYNLTWASTDVPLSIMVATILTKADPTELMSTLQASYVVTPF